MSSVNEKTSVIELNITTGREPMKMPYIVQKKTPRQRIKGIPYDKSFVDLVFQFLRNCGSNDVVVNTPATYPSISSAFVFIRS